MKRLTVIAILVTTLAGVAPAFAVETPISQGRAILFEKGGWRWIG